MEIGLCHEFFDRKIVQEYCELLYVPFVFDCIGDKKKMKEYFEGKDKAREEFNRIMADPKEIKKAVGCYLETINEENNGQS